MKKTSVVFYGGVNEVGGNKILLKDVDTCILFDFGMSFTLRNHYYSVPFLLPKDEKGLLEFGILPELKGLYSFDSTKPRVDAVFLSHSHMDHAAYISLIKRDIPIYCGETTATILDVLSRVRLSGFEFDLSGIKFKTFRTGDKIRIGSLEITPMHVDHSVPGSYGFIVHTSAGTIAYTGDFRRHGSKPNLTEEFLEKCAKEKPEVVISENTNMTGVEVSSEREVTEKLNSIVGHTSGLVMANFACADVDRLNSFYNAAVRNNRSLMITLKQAYLLQKLSRDLHLNTPKLNDDNILIFQKAKKKYHQWEREIMNLGKIADSKEVSEKQHKSILVTSFCDLSELVEIKPSPGSCYILSSSEPFNEEMEMDYNRLTNWLDHYGLPQYHVHVSGHVTPLHLREALKTIKPQKVFPIHGTHPKLLAQFMRDTDSKFLIPEIGKNYNIN